MTASVPEVQVPAVPASTGSHTRARLWLAVVGVSLMLLVPCFWQNRIQAGDLSSHIYNAWLAQLIEHGQAPGLTLVHQTNNILFDWMLSGLWVLWGPAAAQRIAVSAAVLIFFWGAFAFVWSCGSGTPRHAPPWQLAPCLAMLAYGWVFRMGFFNFYISLGLCLGALALAISPLRISDSEPQVDVSESRAPASGTRDGGSRKATAVGLLALAYVAHPLPVAWALAVGGYIRIAQSIAPRHRFRLVAGGLAALAVAGFLLGRFFITRRGADQLMAITGADQVWVYGKDNIAICIALLTIWAICFQHLLNTRGVNRVIADSRFQLCVLSAASVVLLPGGVLFPGYRSGLDFLAERMSLATAVLFCGVLASVRLPKPMIAATTVLAVLFFGLCFREERALNVLENRMEKIVAHLPPGQRAVSVLADPSRRVNPLAHLLDRACIGRCFSYANYEPATAQFRVRADRHNPFVVPTYEDSWTIQTGGYVIKPQDLPLYKIDICGYDLCATPFAAGEIVRNTPVDIVNISEQWRKWNE